MDGVCVVDDEEGLVVLSKIGQVRAISQAGCARKMLTVVLAAPHQYPKTVTLLLAKPFMMRFAHVKPCDPRVPVFQPKFVGSKDEYSVSATFKSVSNGAAGGEL